MGIIRAELFEEIAEKTEFNSVIPGVSFRRIVEFLDQFLMSERTGIHMGAIGKFPWRKVVELSGTSFENPDRKKILSFLESEFEVWLTERPIMRIVGAELDPKFAKIANSLLHKTLKGSGNRLKIDMLSTMISMQAEYGVDEASIENTRSQIRAFVHAHPETFAISRGAMATVYRLQDEKGKPTGMEPDEVEATPRANKTVERYTKSVIAIGFNSKAQFEKAKAELGGAPTMGELQAWLRGNG